MSPLFLRSLPVLLSSDSGGLVYPFLTLYTASKWALEALAESYHYELAPFGIESILIEPSLFATEFVMSLQAPRDQERLIEYGPLKDIPAQIESTTEAAKCEKIARGIDMECAPCFILKL